MRTKVVNLLKYNKTVYALYYYIVSFFINVIKIFVKTDNKLILFNSFAGRKFDDSPKELFDYIVKDERFSEYRLVWAFHTPEKYKVDGAEIVKTDGFKYFIIALKARVWITNSSVERGLDFKGKNTFYLNTWHGTPLKKMGTDIDESNTSFSAISDNKFDAMNAQSEYEADIFSRVFAIPREKFLEFGLPRNDKLSIYTVEDRRAIRKKLNISDNQIAILYCPTFREYEKDENNGCVLMPPMNLAKWEKKLSNKFVLLFRAHYEVSKVMNIKENEFIRNMTDYPSLNDLMIASDLLISDYSSVFFDYSITGKPMFHFTYDYDKYSSLRGMYFDIRSFINGSNNEDELINQILETDIKNNDLRTLSFRNKFVSYYGNATKMTVDFLAKQLKIDDGDCDESN